MRRPEHLVMTRRRYLVTHHGPIKSNHATLGELSLIR
jgi:hypothetical protein